MPPDFDIPANKITESAQRVIDRAIEEARRRNHATVTNEHIFLAFAQIEWDTFQQVMVDLKLNPHEILQTLEKYLKNLPQLISGELRVEPVTKKILKLAYHNATRAGKSSMESSDLFPAIFEDSQGIVASIFFNLGIKPEVVINKFNTKIRAKELSEENLRKHFQLPPFLKHFATNLNLLARQDKIPPIYGRDKEIQQVIEILCHRERSNSVVLIGEPGVGKTAIAEGLANIIEFQPDRIPMRLRDCQIVNLQMNTMVAGTMLRGMFEDRMQNVIKEIKERPNTILFIDEAHTMIGAGSALGAPSDAANVFKSVLSRGEVRIIGATTINEYKQYVQEDEALARRFRTVMINEPTIDETRVIPYKIKPRLERQYSVQISDTTIETVLEISPRYQRHLHLPDKVIGWLDTASVRVEIAKKWDVEPEDIIQVIADYSQIPRDMVFRDVGERFKNMEERLGNRVIGQKSAIRAVANRLLLNKGPLKDGFDRPDGVLLFLGPTGVGKTELAKATAEFLFGDEKKMIRIDMSEYQDGSVSADKLIGMPRGIVGSERGGILTNQLKDNPCSVVLLDEVEKANSRLLNLFLQAFDEGWLTDGRGKRVYLSDSIVIMTSNAGSEHFRKLTNPLGFRSNQSSDENVRSDINREIERRFPPEFRNRIDSVVIFDPLTREEVKQIAQKYLKQIEVTLLSQNKELYIRSEVLDKLAISGYSLAYGARFLKRYIEEKISIPLSQKLITDCNKFHVVVENDEIVVSEDNEIGTIDFNKVALT